MGGIERVDALAMEAVAESLENAVSEILLTGINWVEPQPDPPDDDAVDLHGESARLWVESVLERMEVWTIRARRISAALYRHQLRRPQ